MLCGALWLFDADPQRKKAVQAKLRRGLGVHSDGAHHGKLGSFRSLLPQLCQHAETDLIGNVLKAKRGLVG